MNWRERLADWISGGELSRLIYDNESLLHGISREMEASAQFQEASGKAFVQNEKLADLCDFWARANTEKSTALSAILTARNITEARKIARQALGEGG